MSNMLYILGERLAQVIGKQELSCRGLLRYAVIDSVERLREASLSEIMAYMKTMNYEDWKATVEADALADRLVSIGIKNPAEVVAQLKQTLIEKQSLLTVSA